MPQPCITSSLDSWGVIGAARYVQVRSDDRTLIMLFRKLFGVRARHIPDIDPGRLHARK